MAWREMALAGAFACTAAWAAAEAAPPAGGDPNRDPAYTAQYIRRELTLDLERVDPRRGIAGMIRNDGDRTLTRVSVLLTFSDAQGKPSGEYAFSALPWSGPLPAGRQARLPGESNEKPLGPGGSRNFLVYPSSVPLGWSGRWKAAVESITFAPENTP